MLRTTHLPLALLLALPVAACVNAGDGSDPAPTPDNVSPSIEKTNGGYNTNDEAIAFAAEAELDSAAIEADVSVTDTLASDPAVVDLDRSGRGFKVVVLWGKLPADRDAEAGRTWSGKIKASRGGLVVRRTIGFEDATDQLLPRPSIDTVAFASVTRPFIDGVALTVLDGGLSTTASQTLTYTSDDGAATYSFDLAQLAAGPIVVDAGGGFKMIAIGHRRQADPCDRGFMRGRWHALAPHLGTYLGVVVNEDAEVTGHVRGMYGQRANGEAVMFGKFIDREGQFRGLLIGTYGNGEYRARWITRIGDHGNAHGVYVEGQAAHSGHFLGRWAETSCTLDR